MTVVCLHALHQPGKALRVARAAADKADGAHGIAVHFNFNLP